MIYESLYKEKNVFGGGEPEYIVKEILKYKQGGLALDLGAGQGRNTFFLARSGFKVIAVDSSMAGTETIREEASAQKLSVEINKEDITKFNFKNEYDVILVIFTLHHLLDADARKLITTIQERTSITGLNAIAAFTSDGDFFKSGGETKDKFYP
jgi:tellurite methyltransferase